MAFSVSDISIVSHFLRASLLLLMCYFIFKYFLGNDRRYHYPPGPTGLPFLGSVLSLILTKKQQHEVVTEWTRKYGDVVCIKLLNARLFVLGDARMAQELMGSHRMSDRLPVPIIKAMTGRKHAGVAFGNGTDWQGQRRFSLSFFKKPEGCIRTEEITVAQVERVLAEIENTNGNSFDPNSMIVTSIGNIISKIMTGNTYNNDDPRFQRVMRHSMRVFDLLGPAGLLTAIPILGQIPSPVKWELEEAWNGIFDFVRESVELHRSAAYEGGNGTDFIGSYLKEMAGRENEKKDVKGSFDDENLLQTCLEMIIAGLDTTATSILWGLHTLATHPEAQTRVRREIQDVLGQDRLPQYKDRTQMPVTVATIAECMRYRPIVPFPFIHVITEDCKVGEFDMPKGSTVTMNIWHQAQSPSIWDKPNEFRPERFIPENGVFERNHEPLHFGIGRRVCPGELLARTEIFLFITYIVQHFNLSVAEGVPSDLGSHVGLTIRPKPFKIHATRVVRSRD